MLKSTSLSRVVWWNKVSSLPETTIQRRSHHLIYLVLCSSWFHSYSLSHLSHIIVRKCIEITIVLCPFIGLSLFQLELKRKKRSTLAICLIYQHKFCVSSFKWSSFRSPDKVFGINISLFQWFDEMESSSFHLFTYTYTHKYTWFRLKCFGFDGFSLM